MKLRGRLNVLVCVVLSAGGVFGPTAIEAGRSKILLITPKSVVSADTFKPSCTNPSFPTPAPKNSLGIDSQCGVAGSGSGVIP